MAKCIFTNLTKEQAKVLASWYEGQGEQDADVWFDVSNGIKTPYTDSSKGYYKVQENGDVLVFCNQGENNE
jgi:hypothetical protein